MPQEQTVKIATRGSALALWQANHVADEIRRHTPDCETELVIVKTTGDQDQTSRLESFGGVGVFTREVQNAVMDGRAHLAVHSLKDLPTQLEPGMTLGAIPPRAPRADVLAMATGSAPIKSLEDLPPNARVATGSPRRRAQLLNVRPDVELLEVRGNVGTRLKKMDEGLCDAMLLAEAGLTRLGLDERISLVLSPDSFLPAVGQGALGIECREDDTATLEKLQPLQDQQTVAETTAERTVLYELRAGCHAPLGVWARFDGDDEICVDAVLLTLDGTVRTHVSHKGSASEPAAIGIEVANALKDAHDDIAG
ncbi:MAG: hydroxymethylbilane synthase [Planctomycetaceae bacterium]